MTATFKGTRYNVQCTIKLLLILLALIFTFYILHFTFLKSAFAQDSTPSAFPTSNFQPQYPPSNLQLPTSISPTSPLYTDLLVSNIFHTFSCLAIGQSIIGQPCLTYQMTKNTQGVLQGVPVLSQTNLSGGTFGALTSVIGAMYQNPPVRTADYLATVGKGLGIIKEADAQGVGGSGAAILNPILSLWQVSRNISYIILILIFLVIGLMVMFRNKINPQTVITAQAALPGLIIGLVMITFSYFFAGLISDVAFIGTNIVGYYFSAAQGPTQPPQDLVLDLKDKNVLSIFSPFVGIVSREDASSVVDALWLNFNEDTQRFLTGVSAFLVSQMVSPIGSLFGPAGQLGAAFAASLATIIAPTQVVGTLLWIIATLILLYSMFKLLLRLINNYITIIFLTFTAPFQFLAAALPGRQGIATSWMLNMLANILAFPAVLAVLYFVVFLLPADVRSEKCPQDGSCPFRVSEINTSNNSIIRPAYAEIEEGKINIVNGQTFPLFGGMDLNFIQLLLAFGALVALPSIPDIIGRTIGKLGVAGQLIGQEIGGSVGQGRGYFGQASRAPGALAQQVGKLTDDPGYRLVEGKWTKVTKNTGELSAIEQAQYGVRPGQMSKLRGLFRR